MAHLFMKIKLALTCLCVYLILGGFMSAVEIGFLDARSFFADPDKAFEIPTPVPGGTSYRLFDYAGTEIASGKSAHIGEGKSSISLTLKSGYYEIALFGVEDRLGVVVQSAFTSEVDPFFGMDTGLSTWSRQGLGDRAQYVHVLKRIGVAICRERFDWGGAQKSPELWDFETERSLESTRALFRKSGPQILESFQDAPDFLSESKDKVYPTDHVGVSSAWKEIAARFSPGWGGLEVWNEPDIKNLPADQVAPLVKSIHYTFQSAGIKTPLGGGAIAYLNKGFPDLLGMNGVLDHVDFASFHYYGSGLGIEGQVGTARRWLSNFGRESLPLWLTEMTAPWSGPYPSRAPGKDDRNRALDIALSAGEAKATGLARIFPFLFRNYGEGIERHYGLMDKAGTPQRTVASWAFAIRVLAHANYIGDWSVPLPGIQRARVFETASGNRILMLYTGDRNESLSLILPFTPVHVFGVDGRVLFERQKKIAIPDGLVWIEAKASDLASLKTDTEATRLLALSRKKNTPVKPSPIVIHPWVESEDIGSVSRSYLLSEKTVRIPVETRLFNLSDRTASVSLSVKALSADGKKWKTVEGLAFEKITEIGPKSSLKVRLEIPVKNLEHDPEGMSYVRLLAITPNHPHATPAVLSFSKPLGLESHLARFAYRFALPVGEKHRWITHVADGGESVFGENPESAWQMEVRFASKGNNWSYPLFNPPQEVALERVSSMLIRAKLTGKATARFLVNTTDKKKFVTSTSIIPADGQWHVALLNLDTFVLANTEDSGAKPGKNIQSISLGLNCEALENKLEISDLYLLGD